MRTMVPCIRFDATDPENPVERNTLVTVNVAEEERLVDVHLSPQMEDVQTFSLTVEDGWRFLRELATALAEAEAE